MDDIDTLIKNIQNAKNGASYKIRIKQGEGNDWVTTEFLNLIKEWYKFYKVCQENKCNKHNDVSKEYHFKVLKNKVNRERLKLKSSYFRKKWNEANNDSKKQWYVINFLIRKKQKVCSIESIKYLL